MLRVTGLNISRLLRSLILGRWCCSYYGIPSLSWRDAAYQLMVTKAPGFRHEEVYYDNGHPNGAIGHRCDPA